MTRCTIYPAEGALCGEHYIELNGEHVGTARADGESYAVQFYHVMLYPDDLNDIHDALVLFKQSIVQRKPVADEATLRKQLATLTGLVEELIVGGSWFHSYIELEQHESNHVDGVDMLRKLRNTLRDVEDTL